MISLFSVVAPIISNARTFTSAFPSSRLVIKLQNALTDPTSGIARARPISPGAIRNFCAINIRIVPTGKTKPNATVVRENFTATCQTLALIEARFVFILYQFS